MWGIFEGEEGVALLARLQWEVLVAVVGSVAVFGLVSVFPAPIGFGGGIGPLMVLQTALPFALQIGGVSVAMQLLCCALGSAGW